MPRRLFDLSARRLGGNFGLGPFEIRLHWALPIDIGGHAQPDVWVPNVSLRYAYF